MDLMTLKALKKEVDKKISNKEYIENEIQSLKSQKKELKKESIWNTRALEIVKDCALKTQQQLEFHINDMVTAGLNAVFEDEYKFVSKFIERRGAIECDLFIEKDGKLIDPIKHSGLGVADVASFCLRCAAWSMSNKHRNTLILDEPMKHLSLNYHNKAGELIKTLSEKLNLQIIMVSHSEQFADFADKTFKIRMRKGVSKVN